MVHTRSAAARQPSADRQATTALVAFSLLLFVGWATRDIGEPVSKSRPLSSRAAPVKAVATPMMATAHHDAADAAESAAEVTDAPPAVTAAQAALAEQHDDVAAVASATSTCAASDWSKGAVLVGNRPVGTYLCDYFPKAPKSPGGCTLSCPVARAKAMYGDVAADVPCRIYAKASPEQLTTADIVVNHHGAIPRRRRPEQITVFYSGESNISEGKKAKPEYQQQYAEVVSFHRWRRFHFTWTHRFLQNFLAIERGEKTFPKPKLDAIVVFVSRCGKGGRDAIIKTLANAYTVHSFGGCVRTHRVAETHPECEDRKNRYKEKLCVFSKYRFALTLDNSREEDYVTEKVYHALIAGPIPIYDGAPNVDEFLPTPSSIIRLADFTTSKGADFRKDAGTLDVGRLVSKFKALEKEGTAAPELAWRTQPQTWGAAFRRNLAHEEPTCDLCVEAVARRCAASKGNAGKPPAADE